MRFNHIFLNVKSAIVVLALPVLIAGCRSERHEQAFDPTSSAVRFGAVVMNEADLRTRTLVKNDVKADPFYMDFYIELCTDRDEQPEQPEIGTYVIPSGYSGWLETKENHVRLTWKDLTSKHTFYGWNLPCMTLRQKNDADAGTYDDWITEEKGSTYEEWIKHEKNIKDADPKYPHPLTIEFRNSPEADYSKYRNNEHLENFIGTKAGPVDYKTNGTYVELVFRHLVSKIEINKLSLIDGPHTIINNLKAEMTFFGMPRSATFYPHPTEKQLIDPRTGQQLTGLSYDGNDWEGPVVVANKESIDEDSGLTYFIADDPEKGVDNLFYVCPEIDFSTMVFRIDLKNELYSDRISYYGTFDNVNFVRKKGEDYDEGNDEKILHAGEVMHLVIELYPGIGPGVSVVIDDWSSDQATGRDAVHHSYSGIYTDSEAQDIIDVFKNNPTDEQIRNMYELYGDQDAENVFKLYEDIAVAGEKFPMCKDSEGKVYILNGMGHTVKMGAKTVTIGEMRDIYLTDGTNTIYIDSEGYICKYDSETYEYERTEYQLNGSNSYKINLSTGAFVS